MAWSYTVQHLLTLFCCLCSMTKYQILCASNTFFKINNRIQNSTLRIERFRTNQKPIILSSNRVSLPHVKELDLISYIKLAFMHSLPVLFTMKYIYIVQGKYNILSIFP